MNLPQAFLNRMQKRLGEGFPAFLRSYETPALKGLRVNTLKLSPSEFEGRTPFPLMGKIPWEENGFYIEQEKTGKDPYHFAGLYYLQEPSAMSAVPMLFSSGFSPKRVLDLCAAPGGKTTQLASAMQGKGVLISNEIDPSRAKILSENVERMGVQNAAVLSESPQRLAGQFPQWFDAVVVDAPCSGEGMFKKEINAIPEWSEENVRRCTRRAAEILDCAAQMLSGGGRLLFSTCTFAEEEDEWQVEDFIKRHPDFVLLEMCKLYPHEARGEGHFAALLEKTEGEKGRCRPYAIRRDGKAERAFSEFCKDFLRVPMEGDITTLGGGRMFLIPEGLPAISSYTLRAGVELGRWDGKLFKPAHALAMSLKREECLRFHGLSREACTAYLRGEPVSSDMGNGWCVVGVEEFPLGLGKVTGGTVKNHLPKGLRLWR